MVSRVTAGLPQLAATVLAIASRERVSVEMISQSSSMSTVCLAVADHVADRLRNALDAALMSEASPRNVRDVVVEGPIAIVSFAWSDARQSATDTARFFDALGRSGVNIIAIAQGAGQKRISCCVLESDRRVAERAAIEEFR